MSEKCIKYFCAHYCPYSNKTSKAYDLINNKFKEKYPDVDIEIYWSEEINEDNKHEFLHANAQYVPTITNKKYAHLSLSLPPDFDKEGQSDEELNEALLEHLYEQLDKEPEKKNNVKPTESTVDSKPSELLSDDKNLNEKSKGFLKETFSSLNNNESIKCIIISIIVLLIILPFLKKMKKIKN